MIRFKPRLFPTLFTIPALILLFSLSIWQFYRLYEKEKLISEIENKNALPAILLPEKIDFNDLQYRKVRVQGEFLNDYELHMYGGTRKFKGEQGYYILTPMKLEDNRYVLVNRGWVPEKLKKPEKRTETLINDRVEVEGALMREEKKSLYIHENQLDRNLWFYINLKQIKEHLKLPIENFYILAKEEPDKLPLGKDLSTKSIHNNHLGYALTWLFSAIILIVIYIRYHRVNQ